MANLKYDEIGYWSEIKLDIIKEYAQAYSKIMNTQRFIRKHIYIDAFAGAGHHISKVTKEFVKGSPLNALLVQPPFSEFHLIDLDGDRTKQLRHLAAGRPNVHFYQEDANDVLLQKVFPLCKYTDFRRALCLLDPYSFSVDWQVIKTAGDMKSIEIFFNFMIMDINMNVLRHNPERVPAGQIQRMDKAWGDHSWRLIAYETVPTLFGDSEMKTSNETVAEAFRQRLQAVAGFKFVPSPIPMRNNQGATIYYLYFASASQTGAKIVSSIFKKYQDRGRIK
jgi:three-Cys-motif partner protein